MYSEVTPYTRDHLGYNVYFFNLRYFTFIVHLISINLDFRPFAVTS